MQFYPSYTSPEIYQREKLIRKISVAHCIDISKASFEMLMTLPHMSQNIALHLIHAREAGHLSSLEDLKSILVQCLNCHMAERLAQEWKERLVFASAPRPYQPSRNQGQTSTLTVKGMIMKPSLKLPRKNTYWGD